MLDIYTIRAFVRVIDRGSFSAAAYDLDVTPSSISKHVSRLEREVGAKLLNRSTHKLCLTEAGTIFLERARRVVQDLEEIQHSVHEAQDTVTGSMRLHMTPGTGQRVVLPLILEFMKLHPALSVSFNVRAELPDMPRDGYDLSFSSGTANDGKTRPGGIEGQKLATAHYRIYGSPDYFSRKGRPTQPQDLENHNCLIYSNQPGAHDWLFNGPDGRYSVRVHGSLATDDWSVLYQASLAGLGIARMLTLDASGASELGKLEPIFTELAISDREVWVFYPRMRPTPKKIELLLGFLKSALHKS